MINNDSLDVSTKLDRSKVDKLIKRLGVKPRVSKTGMDCLLEDSQGNLYSVFDIIDKFLDLIEDSLEPGRYHQLVQDEKFPTEEI